MGATQRLASPPHSCRLDIGLGVPWWSGNGGATQQSPAPSPLASCFDPKPSQGPRSPHCFCCLLPDG